MACGRAFWGHLQVEERKSVDAQAALAAFDRQNHAGASDALAANLKQGAQHPQPKGSTRVPIMHLRSVCHVLFRPSYA